VIEHGPDPRTAAQLADAERRESAAWLARHEFVAAWPDLAADLLAFAVGRPPDLYVPGVSADFDLVQWYRSVLASLVQAAVAYRAGALLDSQIKAAIAWAVCVRACPAPRVEIGGSGVEH